MTIKEFVDTNWHRGNVVRLKNGKEYLVKGTKGHGRWLLLYSEEYDAKFVADYRIVDCRTSDYEEPEEVYLEKKRKHQEALARKAAKANKQPESKKAEDVKPKAETKPIEKSKPVVKAEPIVTAEPAPEQPKRKRQRIRISHAEKIQIK